MNDATTASAILDRVTAIGGPGTPFKPAAPERLSARCSWFADDDRLVLVTRDGGPPADAEHALAYGLAYSGNRELWIVTTSAGAELLRSRLPWLSVPVRVFAVDGGDISPVLPSAKQEVLRAVDDPLADAVVQLDERAAWVTELVDWADAAPSLHAVPRSQYLSWHCDGRQVLSIRAHGSGLKLVAGVDAKHPAVGSEPFVVTVEGPLTHAMTLRLTAAAAQAAANRLDGVDVGHAEHLLQARLKPADIGLIEWRREFPATRPGSKRAFIDFLGVDARGDVHVVETKIGADERLILQGLDYWIWATAHAPALRRAYGLSKVPRVHLDFVVAESADGDGFTSIYTPAQVEALDGEIPWRFHTVSGWRDAQLSIQSASRGVVPGAPRRAGGVPPRWANRLDTHLRAWAAEQGIAMRTTRHVKNPLDNIAPRAQAAYRQLDERDLIHHQIANLRSSQAFALNLLAPLDGAAWAELLDGYVPIEIDHAEPAVFEFQDANDRLAEATTASPHTTQTDALVRVAGRDCNQHVVLIEVKLTEPEFGACSAWASERNDRRDICASHGAFGGDRSKCFQLANHDREHRHAYDLYLGPIDGPAGNTGCWFREANQIMRNVALARVLIATGQAASATVALAAPSAHVSIWRQWRQHTKPLMTIPGITFAELPAERVLASHASERASALADRYLPRNDHDEAQHQVRGLQAQLDRLFVDGACIIAEDLNADGELEANYTMPLARPIAALTAAGEPLIVNTEYPAGLTYAWPAELDRQSRRVRVELAPLPCRRVLTNDLRDFTTAERRELADAAARARRDLTVLQTNVDRRIVIR